MTEEKKQFRHRLAWVSVCGIISALMNRLLQLFTAAVGLNSTFPGLALSYLFITVAAVLLPWVVLSSFQGGVRKCVTVQKHLPVFDNILLTAFGLGACITLNFLAMLLPSGDGGTGIQMGFEPMKILLLTGVMAAAPALCEELAFRGIAQTALDRGGTVYAAVVSSVVFGLLHNSLSSALFAFASGLLFALLRYCSGRLLLPMLVHFLNNTIAVLALAAANTFDQSLYQALGLAVLIGGVFLMLSSLPVLLMRRILKPPSDGRTAQTALSVRQKLLNTVTCPVFDGFVLLTLLLKFW